MTTDATDAAIWIGRVREVGSPREHVVRIRTTGDAPTPQDAIEEIDDPFAAACSWSGAASQTDSFRLAQELPTRAGGISGPLSAFELAGPVRPGKIVCVGRNYRAHAEELGNEVPSEPLLFTKPASSIVASGAPIVLPAGYERIDYEGELVVVIGRVARDIAPAEAWDHVAGVTLGNDVSCRDLQRRDKQWTRAKGFDTFAPLGPFVRMMSPRTPVDSGVRVQTFVGDELRQDAPLQAMIFDVPFVLAYLSACMTLEPGDLLFTGTPEGVGPLAAGDVVRVEAVGLALGTLTNPVVASGPASG